MSILIVGVGNKDDIVVTILSVVGSSPNWTATLSAAVPSTVQIGDAITNDISGRTYLIVGISGSDLTLRKIIDTLDPALEASTIDRAFTSMTTAESSISDIAGGGDTYQMELYNDAVLDDALVIDDTTLGSSGALNIIVPSGERHNGTANTGFVLDPSTNADCINISTVSTYPVLIKGLDITGFGHGTGNTRGVLHTGAGTVTVDSCLIHDTVNASGNVAGVNVDSTRIINIRNNIIYNVRSAAGNNNGGVNVGNNAGTLYNNTIVDCKTGIWNFANAQVSRNNAIFDNDSNFILTGGSWDIDFTATDTTAPGGSNNQNSLNSVDEFVSTSGIKNFHININSTLKNNATGLLGTFAGDIDGQLRTLWDIGADQQVVIASGATITETITEQATGSFDSFGG